MADLDVDELVRLRRKSHHFTFYDPIHGDVVSVPIPLRDEVEEPPRDGPPAPSGGAAPLGPAASDDDLRRYISLRETMRAIKQQIDELEPRVLARAARMDAPGTLFAGHGRELFARPRIFPRWTDPTGRDDLLREVGLWERVTAYNWSKFNAIYQQESDLRGLLGEAVQEERRYTLLVRNSR